jgi:hypothetical protein
MRDARAEAIRAYEHDAARLRQQGKDALRAGWFAWYYELNGMRLIAERAARAEITNHRR